jgi:hypothetical protein
VLLLTLAMLLQRLHQLTKALTTTHAARRGGIPDHRPRRRDDGADDGAEPLLRRDEVSARHGAYDELGARHGAYGTTSEALLYLDSDAIGPPRTPARPLAPTTAPATAVSPSLLGSADAPPDSLAVGEVNVEFRGGPQSSSEVIRGHQRPSGEVNVEFRGTFGDLHTWRAGAGASLLHKLAQLEDELDLELDLDDEPRVAGALSRLKRVAERAGGTDGGGGAGKQGGGAGSGAGGSGGGGGRAVASAEQIEAAQALLGRLVEERLWLREARRELLEASAMDETELLEAIDEISEQISEQQQQQAQQYTPFGTIEEEDEDAAAPGTALGTGEPGAVPGAVGTSSDAPTTTPMRTTPTRPRRPPRTGVNAAALGAEEELPNMDDDDGYESFKTALPNMDEIDSMPSSPGAFTPAGQPFTPVRLSYAERAVLASRLDGPQANALLQEVRECHGVPLSASLIRCSNAWRPLMTSDDILSASFIRCSSAWRPSRCSKRRWSTRSCSTDRSARRSASMRTMATRAAATTTTGATARRSIRRSFGGAPS